MSAWTAAILPPAIATSSLPESPAPGSTTSPPAMSMSKRGTRPVFTSVILSDNSLSLLSRNRLGVFPAVDFRVLVERGKPGQLVPELVGDRVPRQFDRLLHPLRFA